MRLEVEKKPPVECATHSQVRSAIMALRSYGPSSFASLTDDYGNYLQVAGGGVTCMLERGDASDGRHFRAYHDIPNEVFADGTKLVFGGGEIKLMADEWFSSSVVADAFLAFLNGVDLPSLIKWRDVTEILKNNERP